MDATKDINDGLDQKSAGGYVKVIFWSAAIGIVFLATEFIILNNQSKNEVATLHKFYLDREDKRSKEERAIYQSVIDREREGHIKQINELNKKVDGISANSDVNRKLANENAVEVDKSRKQILKSYKIIKQNEKR